MKKLLPYLAISGLVAASAFIILCQIFPKNLEIISPLQDEENSIRFNKVENIEKNNNENINTTKQSVSSPSAESNSNQPIRQSDNNVVTASFYTTEYCKRYNPSCLTASGELFTDEGLTAACSYDFELGTEVLLTSNQGSVKVRCNDRGSFEEKYGRTFDLTPTAFSKLSPLSKGVVTVAYQIINYGN